ncbi:hypothetical protein DEI81_06645 [Curtobacterium sp. MCBD17_013]|uniref:hypothetical protein n=1 Tax=Curtobacterium sp. MCBD17_013 TaxID=2175668 RepID=UPI000DA75FDC|nr:hypothetical protein [Curtobacterium sp. MCBD17_013]PZF63769.1 hypothetical protein DEI81_06645 [Curtobacterium sp. MCBD17_013]
MTDAQKVQGKVAEIVSDREVILNRGERDGVEQGMYFAILDPDFVSVTDPDSNEDLGGIRLVKVAVQAVEVAPHLTLARTFRTRTVNVGGTAAGIGSILAATQPPRYVERVERLTIDESTRRKIDPSESVVGRGDPFEEIDEDDAEDIKSITIWR